MKFFANVTLLLLQSFLFPLYSSSLHQTSPDDSSPFPSDFLFGTSSSAYQYEGAYLTDGKGLNNWDVFSHENPGDILDGGNGDIAVDQYNRFMEDIQSMNYLGVNSYRFSISWSRVLPKGRLGSINHLGIKHYNRLIDALIRNGITPFVTLNHFDYPQELENRFKSWLSPEMQKEFGYLADTCFKYFGDRVKHWITINEPNQQIILSYLKGIFPPNRCSMPFGNCSQGNSETEPFIAAHNTILAHAKAVQIYQTKYKVIKQSNISHTSNVNHPIPNPSRIDVFFLFVICETGGRFGGINYSGIKYYNRLIDALISRGIKPFVTLNHLDYPQELENRFQSWLSPEMQNDFGYLADICFKHFGDRVKHWTTLNEPNQQIILTHLKGTFPPSRCSLPYGNCSQGNSEREPFIAAHNTILAHAKAVHIYRSKYQVKQRGIIGIVVQTSWFEPISDSIADREAAERAQSFYSNWILDPIIYGKYPKEMVNVLGSALPRFSRKEMENLKQLRLDFIGINHYTSYFIQDCLFSTCNAGDGASKAQGFALKLDRKGNVSIGELTDVNWQHIHPEGFRKTLNYLKNRYHNIPMFITENGFGDLQKPETTLTELLNDTKRIQYMSGYLDALQSAMRDGANVKGYFAWSLLDNFEWLYGYKLRFGLFHVDYTSLKRTPKLSASWYKNYIGEHIRRKYY
uniref:Sinigrinase n=1 Tax=Brassica campestris TaxID=3711 RepID=A0A3P5ZW49_BRACM|nr:unnamed protein product [Brassica rapa]